MLVRFTFLGCFLLTASALVAQPSFTFTAGYGFFVDSQEDYFRLSNQWALKSAGNGPSNSMTFFSEGSGLVLNAGLSWEISPHFSAGLGLKISNFSMPGSYRKGEIVSFGPQFRINFSANTSNVVPFLDLAAYLYNSQTLNQDQFTITSGAQTQPAFSTKVTTPIALHVQFGLEFKVSKPIGLLIQSGLNGTMPGDTYLGTDYGIHENPTDYDGGWFMSVSGGMKYYFGRGVKQRDF